MRSILVAAFVIFVVSSALPFADPFIYWFNPAFGEENQAQLDPNATTPAETTENSQARSGSSTSTVLPADKTSGEAGSKQDAKKHSKSHFDQANQAKLKAQEEETGNLHKVHMFLTGSNCYACLKELEDKMKVLEGIYEVKIERPSTVSYSSFGGEIQYPEGNLVYNPEKINMAQIVSFMKTQGYYPYKIVDKLRK